MDPQDLLKWCIKHMADNPDRHPQALYGALMGAYYQYPPCCIITFLEQRAEDAELQKHRPKGLDGRTLCDQCSGEEQTSEGFVADRLHHHAFVGGPMDGKKIFFRTVEDGASAITVEYKETKYRYIYQTGPHTQDYFVIDTLLKDSQ